MLDLGHPLFAKIYDFHTETLEDPDDVEFIVRQVEKIEFPCVRHAQPVIWYSNGMRSDSFELIPQEVSRDA